MSTAARIQASRPGIRDFPLADLPFLRFGPSFRHFVDSSADFVLGFRLLAGMIGICAGRRSKERPYKRFVVRRDVPRNACTKKRHAPTGA